MAWIYVAVFVVVLVLVTTWAKHDQEMSDQAAGCMGLIVASVLVVSLSFFVGGASNGNDGQDESIRLTSEVRFTGEQFIIRNRDTFDWTNVELAVNPGVFNSGYTLNADRVEAGETYTVGAMQFADSDGQRFNPATHKPTSFRITADTPNGEGFDAGEWQ